MVLSEADNFDVAWARFRIYFTDTSSIVGPDSNFSPSAITLLYQQNATMFLTPKGRGSSALDWRLEPNGFDYEPPISEKHRTLVHLS
jgi:hypothetical protein